MPSQKLDTVINDMKALKDERIKPLLNFYKTRTTKYKNIFWTAGTAIIVLSGVIPFLSILQCAPTWLVPAIASAIGILSGLSSFYQWQHFWHTYGQTVQVIEDELGVWQFALSTAKYATDETTAINVAIQATEQLLRAVHIAHGAELAKFVERTKAIALQQSTPPATGTSTPGVRQS